MIAVVAKADQPELFNLVRTIFHAWTEAGSEIRPGQPARRVGARSRSSTLTARSGRW